MSTVKIRIVCVSDTVSKEFLIVVNSSVSSRLFSTTIRLAKDTNYPKETFSSTPEILQIKAVSRS